MISSATAYPVLHSPGAKNLDQGNGDAENGFSLTDVIILGSTIAVTAPLAGLVCRSIIYPPLKEFIRRWRKHSARYRLQKDRLRRKMVRVTPMDTHVSHPLIPKYTTCQIQAQHDLERSKKGAGRKQSKTHKKKTKHAKKHRRQKDEAAKKRAELLRRQQQERARQELEQRRREEQHRYWIVRFVSSE